MSLGEKQEKFSRLIVQLMTWAHKKGYEIRCGDFFATTGHSANSFHYKKLAADLNLFKDGVYLMRTEDHLPLGNYWKSLDSECTWGGDFPRKDGNHYSLGEH
jgi:hypothetical protein